MGRATLPRRPRSFISINKYAMQQDSSGQTYNIPDVARNRRVAPSGGRIHYRGVQK
jgi:hypothetical protein